MTPRDLANEVSSRGEIGRLRFGVFDLDTQNRELRRRGLRVKLQQKPFQILHLLLSRAGKFVSRGQLAQHLWPDLHVNFDRSLNTAVNSLRRALGDSPENPRFIETRAGLGYRFIAQVEFIEEEPSNNHATQVERVYAGNVDAYHDYLKGRYFQNKMTEEDLRRSVGYFEAALAAEPDCALAYAGLADTYSLLAYLGILTAKEAYQKASGFIASALRIDGQLAEAHTGLGGLKKSYEWDWAGAEAAYRQALSLKPNDAHARRMYASLLSALERHPEAMQELRRAQQLDPLSLVINAEAAWALYMARDFQGAVDQAWRTLAMEPRFAPAQHALGLAYQQMGMLEDAIIEFQNARVCSSDHPAAIAALCHAYAAAGQRSEAEELLGELQAHSRNRHVSAYWVALMHVGLGDDLNAVRCLKEALDDRDVWLVWLAAEPRFQRLRSSGRLDDLLTAIQGGARA
ncbi:MAG TPA: winged helix-turn-helix domain-containing protein [Bryobacteraceae bacterium]|nr:winged helix-turn-helix domain-containing protein [Bryobacteraceae bacterium]